MIRRRYYRVLDNSSGDKKSHFIEQKTLIDDEDYKVDTLNLQLMITTFYWVYSHPKALS